MILEGRCSRWVQGDGWVCVNLITLMLLGEVCLAANSCPDLAKVSTSKRPPGDRRHRSWDFIKKEFRWLGCQLADEQSLRQITVIRSGSKGTTGERKNNDDNVAGKYIYIYIYICIYYRFATSCILWEGHLVFCISIPNWQTFCSTISVLLFASYIYLLILHFFFFYILPVPV